MPFTNHAAWLTTQLECPDLRRAHAHLSQGTRPSKKETCITYVKRYIKTLSIADDNLLVVWDSASLQLVRDRFAVLSALLDGLLTALHIRFHHPIQHQLKQLMTRYFFALDLDRTMHAATTTCHHCLSLVKVPIYLQP